MIGLNANDRAKAFVDIVNCLVSTAPSTLIHQPQVGEGGRKGGRDVAQTPFTKIWEKIVQKWKGKKGVRSEHKGKKHDCG